jgi:hypothetical protein
VNREITEVLHRLWFDERVRHFLRDGKVVPFEQTEAVVERSYRPFEECGFGLRPRASATQGGQKEESRNNTAVGRMGISGAHFSQFRHLSS